MPFHKLIISLAVLMSTVLTASSQTDDRNILKTLSLLRYNQSIGIDSLATFISANFSEDEEKIRAIFLWMASHLNYDLEGMNNPLVLKNRSDYAVIAMRTRRAVCQGYAELFKALCHKVSVKAWVVEGYTKHDGKVMELPHAWNIVFSGDRYSVIDVTWATGVIENESYVKKMNDNYYMISPLKALADHMPFDPLWQMVRPPLSHMDFINNSLTDHSCSISPDFADSLLVFEEQDTITRLEHVIRRILGSGTPHILISNYMNNLRAELKARKDNLVVREFNRAVSLFNEGAQGLNKYAAYFNKQFSPPRSDHDILLMAAQPAMVIREAISILDSLSTGNPDLSEKISRLRKDASLALKHAEKNTIFVKKYISSPREKRKLHFRKN